MSSMAEDRARIEQLLIEHSHSSDPGVARRARISLQVVMPFEMCVNTDVKAGKRGGDADVLSDAACSLGQMLNFIIDHIVVRGSSRKAARAAAMGVVEGLLNHIEARRDAAGAVPEAYCDGPSGFDFRAMLRGED